MSDKAETIERLLYSRTEFNPKTQYADYLRDLVTRSVEEGVKLGRTEKHKGDEDE